MTISSRTPEGDFNHCPVCQNSLVIEPSQPAGEAPCPNCGHLLWFGPNLIDFAVLGERRLQPHPSTLALVPESIARENTIIPLAVVDEELWIAVPARMSAGRAHETLLKLEFILERKVRLVRADPRRIHEAIEKHYEPVSEVDAAFWFDIPDE